MYVRCFIAFQHTKSDPRPGAPFQGAKEGCLNVVRQAEKAGIKHIVVMSSVTAVLMLVPGVTIKAPLTSNGTPPYIPRPIDRWYLGLMAGHDCRLA